VSFRGGAPGRDEDGRGSPKLATEGVLFAAGGAMVVGSTEPLSWREGTSPDAMI
jgi:hypothetical protein